MMMFMIAMMAMMMMMMMLATPCHSPTAAAPPSAPLLSLEKLKQTLPPRFSTFVNEANNVITIVAIIIVIITMMDIRFIAATAIECSLGLLDSTNQVFDSNFGFWPVIVPHFDILIFWHQIRSLHCLLWLKLKLNLAPVLIPAMPGSYFIGKVNQTAIKCQLEHKSNEIQRKFFKRYIWEVFWKQLWK